MRRRRVQSFSLLGMLGLLASLLSFSSHAGDTMERAGALVWDMGEMYWDFNNQHIARGMTPEKVKRLAVKVARKMASRRDDLAELLPALAPESPFARDVKRFVEGWPDRQAFQDDLLRFGQGEELGMALSGLKSQVPDSRRGWKTPFPFFRP
jgi:hypothetical protein